MFAPIASDRAVAEGARITRGCSGPRPASPEEILSTRRSRGASEGLSAEGSEPSPAEHPAASSNKNAIVPVRTIRGDLTIPNLRGDESFDGEEIDPLMRFSHVSRSDSQKFAGCISANSSGIHRCTLSCPQVDETAWVSGAVEEEEHHHAKPTSSSRIAPDRSTDTTLGRRSGYDHTYPTRRCPINRCPLSVVCSDKEARLRQCVGTPRRAEIMAGIWKLLCCALRHRGSYHRVSECFALSRSLR